MSESEAVEKKEKKEKKVMTPERLEQLARARKKALEIRQAGAAIKEEQKQLADAALEEKLQREKELNDAVKASLLKNEIEISFSTSIVITEVPAAEPVKTIFGVVTLFLLGVIFIFLSISGISFTY